MESHVYGVGLGSWWKLLFGLVIVAAGMGCFDCVGSSFGRSYFAQHDRVVNVAIGSLRLLDSEAAVQRDSGVERMWHEVAGWAGGKVITGVWF